MATTSRLRDPRSTSDADLSTITSAEVNTLRLKAVAALDHATRHPVLTEGTL